MADGKSTGDAAAIASEETVEGAAGRFRARPLNPDDLKAFTHPLRMAMYSALSEHGPATATQLAKRLGESSGQTSYHLRQLERHGFVEDDPEHTGGRERWWRSIGFSVDPDAMVQDPATEIAMWTVLEQSIAERGRVLRQFADSVMSGRVPFDLLDTTLDSSTVELTSAEAGELINAVESLLHEHLERAKARKAAGEREGRRRTRVYFDVLPLVGSAADDVAAAPETDAEA